MNTAFSPYRAQRVARPASIPRYRWPTVCHGWGTPTSPAPPAVKVVAADYTDYGHTPPGRGPDGARDDYENAVRQAGAVIRFQIDALVTDGDTVAAAWTGTLPGGPQIGKGLSLYQTTGGLLRSTRHALIAPTPN
jgi:hypothetical protein